MRIHSGCVVAAGIGTELGRSRGDRRGGWRRMCGRAVHRNAERRSAKDSKIDKLRIFTIDSKISTERTRSDGMNPDGSVKMSSNRVR